MNARLFLCMLLSVLTAASSFSVSAQTSRPAPQTAFSAKQWQLGIKAGHGRGDLLRNRNTFQLYAGYYVGGLSTRQKKDKLN